MWPEFKNEDVAEGGFLIIRFLPSYQNRGIIATKITEIYDDGFGYENLGMGVQGDYPDFLDDIAYKQALVILPNDFKPPVENDFIYSVGGLYIPKEKEVILPDLSRDKYYQKSLECLKDPEKVMTMEELQQVLEE